MRDKYSRTVNYKKDAFTTAYATFWSECIVGTGDVSIASNKLKLNAVADTDVAAVVTSTPEYVRNCKISVAVDASASTPARAGIVLAQTKVTTSNPESENDVLIVCLDDVNNKLLIKTNVAGAGAKTLYNENWTAESETLVIDIEPDGYFTVSEGTAVKFTGTLPFDDVATPDRFIHYIYLYAIAANPDLGYALFNDFQLDLDTNIADEIRGDGVRRAALMEATPVFGRLLDLTGNAVFFQTDTAIDGTPTQTITLSRDVKRFRLEQIRFYMNQTAAETFQLLFLEGASADDMMNLSKVVWLTPAALADVTEYFGTVGAHLATGGAVFTNDPLLPAIFNLERPGQLFFAQDWSTGTPGLTPGFIIVVGREVD